MITFYPFDEDLEGGNLEDRIEVLTEAASRFKATILDVQPVVDKEKKRLTPRDLKTAFNWQELATLLRELRDLPEASSTSKLYKAKQLDKLAEIYEILRGAKMPKLEAVRLALMNEAKHLRGG